MTRRLRIAVSVFFAMLPVLVCVLWVRSYWRSDQVDFPITGHHGVSITSVRGQMSCWRWNGGGRIQFWSQTTEEWLGHPPVVNEYFDFPPHQGLRINGGTLWIPHAFVVFLFAVLAILPCFQLSYRFSLRTLLIATAIVAILLGLAVWVAA